MYNTPRQQKVLVVEDDVDIQQILCFFLKKVGLDALGVSGGQQAIEIIPEYHPDLIILDIMMSPVTGWDVLHCLRDKQLLPALPIILLTALVQLTEQIQGFEEGAVEYLTKPTQPSIIVERVQTLLSLSVEQRSLLQHKRIEEQRKMLERIYPATKDEFIY